MKKRIWQMQKGREPDTLDLSIYDDITADYLDLITGETVHSETSAKFFKEELEKYPDVKKINLFIRSYGGCFLEGTAIYCLLKRHSAEKVVTIDGFACSAAATIAMVGDKVIMPRNSMILIHNVWITVTGDAKELRKAADDLDIMMEANRQAYLQKSNGKISEGKLKELLAAGTWLTADSRLNYGFADEVTDGKADPALAKQAQQRITIAQKQVVGYSAALTERAREFKKVASQSKLSRMIEAVATKNRI